MAFDIKPLCVDDDLKTQLKHTIDNKTKPIGSLGRLEDLAYKIASHQGTIKPSLNKPTILIFAGDHGIAKEMNVNAFPQEVTHQMVLNFLSGGAAINVFSEANGLDLKVIDAGVVGEFDEDKNLINAKISNGTKNYLVEPAMSFEQLEQCIEKGREIVDDLHEKGCNVVGFGEMGIGNTSASALWMHKLSGIKLKKCVGKGTGLDKTQFKAKLNHLKKASRLHQTSDTKEVMRCFGGFEMAMMYGAIGRCGELKKTILVDGFIVSNVVLAVYKDCPHILNYCVFSHISKEKGHRRLLKFLKQKAFLNLDLRLGEATGVALFYPLVKCAVNFLNDMNSFDKANVSNKI